MLRTRTTFTGILGSLLLLAACGDDPMAPEAGEALDFEIPEPSLTFIEGGEVNTTITVPVIQCSETGIVTVEIEGITPPPEDAPVEVVLVLDESGSILSNFSFVRQAALALLDELDFSRTTVGLVYFSRTARVVTPLSGDKAALTTLINTTSPQGGTTNITDGLRKAQSILAAGSPVAAKTVVVLSDGRANEEEGQLVSKANELKNAGVEIFTVGVGGAIASQLTAVASPGNYFPAANFSALAAVFQAIGGSITYPAALDLTFSADVPTGFTLEAGSASASKGSVSESGATVIWTVGRLEEETITLTYVIRHDDAAASTGGTLTAVENAVLTLTTPVSGSPFSETQDDVTTEVEGCDTTPPEISYVLDGTLGDDDWYVSDVDLLWAVVDPDSPVTIDDGCVDETFLTDGTYTRSCTASSDGGTAGPVEVTFKRDATAPTVDYPGNLGAYDIADPVEILCTVDDNLSGVASDTCADVTGGAWTFDLGLNEFSAEATDNAGNVGGGSTAFTVDVSYDGLCALVEMFVTHKGVANSLCVKLAAAERAAERGNANAQAGPLGAFIQEVEAQDGKKVPSEIAPVLIAGAQALMP